MWDIKMKTKQKWNLIQESISKRPISTKHNPKYITKTVKFCGKFNVLGLHQKQWYKKVDKNQWNIEQWKIYFYAKVSPITRYSREWNIPTWWVTLPYITCNKNKFLIDKDITLLQDWSAVQSFDFIIIEPRWRELKTWVYNWKSKNLQEFWFYCQKEWQNIPDATVFKLYSSIPHQAEVVVHVNGSHTKYWFWFLMSLNI